MKNALGRVVAAVAVMSVASFASAATLFESTGDSLNSFTVLKDSAISLDSTADVLDYSTLGIPEAPGSLAGGAARTGIMLTANKGDATGAVTGINLLLGTSGGTPSATPQTFTGTHTLQYYVWANIPSGAAGTTEYFSGGVARTSSDLPIYNNFRTGRGNGGWFVMTNDNGLATDYRHLDNGTAATAITGNETSLATQYNAAFKNNYTGTGAPDPANEWVKVDVLFDATAGTTSVYLNNVLFSTLATTNTSGFAWLGYEDAANSIGTAGLGGIFDNIRLVEGNAVPEPTTLAALAGLGGLAFVRRRKA